MTPSDGERHVDHITVIVVPDETSPVRRFQVRRALLRHGIWLGLVLMLGLLAGMVDYVRLRLDAVDVEQLRVETEAHRQNLISLSRSVEDLEGNLSRIREFERKVRVIADLPAAMPETSVPELRAAEPGEGAGQGLPTGPAGGEEGPWNAGGAGEPGAEASGDLPLDEAAIRRIQRRTEQVSQLTRGRSESLEALIEELRGKSRRLASTPSIWPADGWVTSGFGYRTSPFTGNRKFHAGVDIAANFGTPIVAPARGKVVFVGRKGPLGKSVTLDHGFGIRSSYGHAAEIFVKLGEEVDRGQRIASVGSTGRSTGPHVHYALVIDKKSVNPMNYILE